MLLLPSSEVVALRFFPSSVLDLLIALKDANVAFFDREELLDVV